MKFIIGEPPESAYVVDPLAVTIKWSPNFIAIISALLGAALMVGLYFFWPFKPDVANIKSAPLVPGVLFMLILVVVLFLHELVHLLFVPNGLVSKTTIIGLSRKKLCFYAYTKETLSWSNSLVSLLAPFAFLTMLPITIEFFTGTSFGILAMAAICNIALSANDIIVAIYIIFKVPANAVKLEPGITGIRYTLNP